MTEPSSPTIRHKKGTRRRWGAVEQQRSGLWRASYRPAPGAKHMPAPTTFATKGGAVRLGVVLASRAFRRAWWIRPDSR